MARAKRHYIPGHVWHITHRCHKREFLLKFAKDRYRWLQWLLEARKRYGLTVLNYTITSNHIHLLVYDGAGRDVIPRSIQLVAGRTGQEYNERKKRKGAFWEDRYHATAIETGKHLYQCMVYIDLNMVRCGVVKHPKEWRFAGYNEINHPSRKFRLIDHKKLLGLLASNSLDDLRDSYNGWIEEALKSENINREIKWTKSIAVGSEEFVNNTKKKLGSMAKGRKVREAGDSFEFRESQSPYRGHFDTQNGVGQFYES